MSAAEWIERMRGQEVAAVAGALGYAVRPAGSAITVGPCPACKAERRHEGRRDRRGAVGIRRRTPGGWACHACGITGDALHFVALHFTAKKLGELDPHDLARVREWCTGYVGGVGGAAPAPRPAEPLPPPEPRYAPSEELRAVWSAGARVCHAPAVARWLERDRGLSPRAIDQLGLARVLLEGPAPEWARFESGSTYAERGFRLLVPMFDARGRARSLIFRRTYPAKGPKSVPPRGYDRIGLVMACANTRALLEGRACPLGEAPTVVIAEGEMDWLAWATAAAAPVAALGIVSGSWSPELAARIPDGARVLLATDLDRQGERYAADIVRSLAGRARAGALELERWKGAAA